MPRNIEVKARVRDFAELCRRAEALSDTPREVLEQADTFFLVPHGRLKLREIGADYGQLIFYTRPNLEGPKRSEYQITSTNDPQGLKNVLAMAYGIRGVVKKTRFLYLCGQTRIHIDQVQGLGRFIELEVVLRPEQTDAEGQSIAEDLMNRLGLPPGDLLEGAYMDLIEGR